MSITLAGMLVTFSGIAVVLAALMILPPEVGTFKYVVFGIGWVFIIIGIAVRIYGMKMEKKIDQLKQKNK